MKIIGGERACGKTTSLIEIANEKDIYILCKDQYRARVIWDTAKDIGIKIKYPITVDEIRRIGHRRIKVKLDGLKDILIDDVEDVIRYMTGMNPLVMTSSFRLEPRQSNRNL